MVRVVVFRQDGMTAVNVNDEIGLEGYSDYTVQEHLDDLRDEGLMVTGQLGDVYLFSDGSAQHLRQGVERIEMSKLHGETQTLVMMSAAMRSSQHQCAAGTPFFA